MKLSYSAASKLLLLTIIGSLVACSGPTKRFVDGKWAVSENICSSDPDQPELGDMRSEIRQSQTYQTNYERRFNFYHNDRSIMEASQRFDRTNTEGQIKYYENSPENSVSRTVKFNTTPELNKAMSEGFVAYFKDDPRIDARDAHSGCLFRGQ